MSIKNIIVITIIVIANLNCIAQETDYSVARVGKKIYGVYIFLRADPYQEYEYIATVEVKINWTGSLQESFEKAINKAKKKYPYFNGMIFQNSSFDKVDLIRFKGLDVSRGGFSIGSKVSFIEGNEIYYGEVVELESSKGKGTVKYRNIFNEEKIKKMPYTSMTPVIEEDYSKKKSELLENIEKYQYSVGQKALWIGSDETNFGEIISLDERKHNASIKYINIFGEEKVASVLYLDINIIPDSLYGKKLIELKNEIDKHSFLVGEKVSWIKSDLLGQNPEHIIAEIIELNDSNHKASIKYMDNGNEKISKVSYLELTKTE